MRLTKEEFIKGIDTLKTMMERNNEICDVLETVEWKGDKFVDEYYDLLIAMCDIDAEHSDWDDVSYFIWDLEFGEKYTPGCLSDDDGDIDISTADKLYDYLIASEKKGEDE